MSWQVIDNEYNRRHYPDHIGKVYTSGDAPPYALLVEAAPEPRVYDEAQEMRDLAQRVGDELEAEAAFDPEDWEPGDAIPSDIADHLSESLHVHEWGEYETSRFGGSVSRHCLGCSVVNLDMDSEDGAGIDEDSLAEARETLQTAYDDWRESATDSVLDIRAEVDVLYYGGGGLSTRSVTIVLGTGGPHVEVELSDDGSGRVIAYSWFGANRAEYPIRISGHPLMSIVELTIEQIDSGGER